jgi:hypothetical protein
MVDAMNTKFVIERTCGDVHISTITNVGGKKDYMKRNYHTHSEIHTYKSRGEIIYEYRNGKLIAIYQQRYGRHHGCYCYVYTDMFGNKDITSFVVYNEGKVVDAFPNVACAENWLKNEPSH